MDKISPKERFSTHAKIGETPTELVLEAAARFGLNQSTITIEPLSGGFMNANFLIRSGDHRYVFRVYSTNKITAERETDTLHFLKEHPVLAPKAIELLEVRDRYVAILEYLDGITLEDKLINDGEVSASLYEEIGRQLGHIHNIRFDCCGFIGPSMKIGREYDDFSRFLRQFIERTISQLSDERLDAETRRRFGCLVNDKWDIVLATEPRKQLVHCDFNPKNILVSKQSVSAVVGIVDWEFTLSGNGLIDFGNFFRFSYDYGPNARESFVRGYRSVNQELPGEWEAASKLLDLGNVCSFLERKEDYQKTFRTARAVLTATLEYFGY